MKVNLLKKSLLITTLLIMAMLLTAMHPNEVRIKKENTQQPTEVTTQIYWLFWR